MISFLTFVEHKSNFKVEVEAQSVNLNQNCMYVDYLKNI